MASRLAEIVLVRHAETEWSRSGRHTGHTDVPLTERGRVRATELAVELSGREFGLVLTSPLSRASETCRLASFGERAEQRDELKEWDYGAYEGRRSAEIRAERPGWSLWRDGVPDGETAEQVAERVDPLVAQLRASEDDVLVFSHGHLLRVLAARWLGLDPRAGALLVLDPGSLGVLGYERETPVLRLWNSGALAERV